MLEVDCIVRHAKKCENLKRGLGGCFYERNNREYKRNIRNV